MPLVTTTPSCRRQGEAMTEQNDQTLARYEFKEKPGDGAHWGVDEPYPEVVDELMRAIDSGLDFDSGFYSSKKEIKAGRIERRGDVMWASVSVSNDFDCEAVGEVDFPFAELVGKDRDGRMEVIARALNEARDKACEQQKDNEVVALYCIGRDKGEYHRWEFTYLRDVSDHGFDAPDAPPGDNYHRWGWQEVDTDDDSDITSSRPGGARGARAMSSRAFRGVPMCSDVVRESADACQCTFGGRRLWSSAEAVWT